MAQVHILPDGSAFHRSADKAQVSLVGTILDTVPGKLTKLLCMGCPDMHRNPEPLEPASPTPTRAWSLTVIQFMCRCSSSNMAQAAYCQLYSPYPRQLSTLLFFYMITLLVLFLNFYLSKHGDAKQRSKRGHVKTN